MTTPKSLVTVTTIFYFISYALMIFFTCHNHENQAKLSKIIFTFVLILNSFTAIIGVAGVVEFNSNVELDLFD